MIIVSLYTPNEGQCFAARRGYVFVIYEDKLVPALGSTPDSEIGESSRIQLQVEINLPVS